MPLNTYTTGSGVWTAPANLNNAVIEAWGAGGGGAGSNTNSTAGGGGGGGGGAYAEITVTGLTSGNTYPYVIGQGGAGGPAGNNNGSPGNTTTFNNNTGGNTGIILGANGGAGGINAQNTGNKAGLGGAANGSAGVTSFKGGNGANNGGTRLGGGGGAGAGNANAGTDSSGQTGASGANGGGTGGNGGARNANGNNYQTDYGAGGGGAGQSNGTARAGGYGGGGYLIITSYIDAVSQNKYAYTNGQAAATPANSSTSAYTDGLLTGNNSYPAYVKGLSTLQTSSKYSYTRGLSTLQSNNHSAFTQGALSSNNSHSAYTNGYSAGGPVSSSHSAFTNALGSAGSVLLPDADMDYTGYWYKETGSQSNLYQSIDEYPIPNDNDYIYNSDPTIGDYYEFSLTNPSGIPGPGDVTIFYRGKDKSGLNKSKAHVELRQGDVTIIASGEQILTTTPSTYYFILSQAQRDNITDWNDLRIRINVIII